MIAFLSIAASVTTITTKLSNDVLPKVDGYLVFETNFGSTNWYAPNAPDPSGQGGPYSSTRAITDPNVLTMICDVYSDACQWHNGGAGNGAIGTLPANSTVHTYVKKTIGNIVDGSTPSAKYFALDETRSTNAYCTPYVGWALPLNLVKTQCDQDSKCDAFVMKLDDSYGELCSFSPEGVCRNCRLHLKLA